MKIRRLAAAGMCAAALAASPARGVSVRDVRRVTTTGVITEFPVAHSPQNPVAGPDGAVWFDTTTNELGRIVTHGDANEDGVLDVADVFYLVNSLFAGVPAPK